MSKIHILEGQGAGVFHAVIHFATPAGNNSSGMAWSDVLTVAGRNVSVLPTGNLPGQITAADLALVTAGTLVEFEMLIPIESGGSSGQTLLTSLNDMVDREITRRTAELQVTYKHFGRVVA
jgi:hypothetical protein